MKHGMPKMYIALESCDNCFVALLAPALIALRYMYFLAYTSAPIETRSPSLRIVPQESRKRYASPQSRLARWSMWGEKSVQSSLWNHVESQTRVAVADLSFKSREKTFRHGLKNVESSPRRLPSWREPKSLLRTGSHRITLPKTTRITRAWRM